MGTLITHPFIIFLYYLFPNNFNLVALFIGSLIPDIEYFIMFGYYFFFKRKSYDSTIPKINPLILHSILGVTVFCLPLTVLLTYFITGKFAQGFIFLQVVLSAAIGIVSHLIVDIPAHNNLSLFWPWKVYDKNQLVLFKNFNSLEKLYILSNKYIYRRKKFTTEYMPEFNWMVFSHILPIASYILVKVLV